MKVCPKCKMQIRDDDKICQFCGAAQMSDDSPMKNYEEAKAKRKEKMTPERRKSKRQENFVYFSNFVLLVLFIGAIGWAIYYFFIQGNLDTSGSMPMDGILDKIGKLFK